MSCDGEMLQRDGVRRKRPWSLKRPRPLLLYSEDQVCERVARDRLARSGDEDLIEDLPIVQYTVKCFE